MQQQYTKEKNQALVGSTQIILTDGLSKKQVSEPADTDSQTLQWTGRTFTNKIVNFSLDETPICNENLTGRLIDVRIERALSHSLFGKATKLEPTVGGLKGVENYAA